MRQISASETRIVHGGNALDTTTGSFGDEPAPKFDAADFATYLDQCIQGSPVCIVGGLQLIYNRLSNAR